MHKLYVSSLWSSHAVLFTVHKEVRKTVASSFLISSSMAVSSGGSSNRPEITRYTAVSKVISWNWRPTTRLFPLIKKRLNALAIKSECPKSSSRVMEVFSLPIMGLPDNASNSWTNTWISKDWNPNMRFSSFEVCIFTYCVENPVEKPWLKEVPQLVILKTYPSYPLCGNAARFASQRVLISVRPSEGTGSGGNEDAKLRGINRQWTPRVFPRCTGNEAEVIARWRGVLTSLCWTLWFLGKWATFTWINIYSGMNRLFL